jgi:hypothetical protein
VVDEFEADLYQSLFNAFAENDNLPLNDTDIPSLTTDSITSNPVPACFFLFLTL